MGAPAWRAAEGPEDETDALVALPRLDLPHLGWPEEPVKYYGAGDVLAYAHAGFLLSARTTTRHCTTSTLTSSTIHAGC
jgi:hypothetical protein